MKCTKCGLREATTEVLRRHNNNIEKMYLCNECAAEIGSDISFDEFDLLNKLINGSPMGLVTQFFDAPTTKKLVCPECKTTGEEFLQTGFVGCPKCYDVFEPIVAQTVKKLQQSDRHIGKTPFGAIDYKTEVQRLKGELQAAIDRGDYEKVSEISDRLGRLTSENSGNGGKQ